MNSILYLMIPCYNEALTLGTTLYELTKSLKNREQTKILVVDDGSSDDSAKIAESCGAEVLRLEHVGLARAYAAGLKEVVRRGADYLISLDADGQYDPTAIPDVLGLLQSNQADVVLVERSKSFYQRMSWQRRLGHVAGRFMVRTFTGLSINDPVTGYRGYSRHAAQQLEIQSAYTYTLETLVQIPSLKLNLKTLTAEARITTRPSRLFGSPLNYVMRQAKTLLWASWHYKRRGQPIFGDIETKARDHALQNSTPSVF
jgi:glycosyltransferase involved in cell wall biosynthesis